jgi:phosphate transport system permease protein
MEAQILKVGNIESRSQRVKLKRMLIDKVFHGVLIAATLFGIIMLIILMRQVFTDGLKYLDLDFLFSMPSRFAEKAGIYSALVGTIITMLVTAAAAIPIGIGTALYIEEYADQKKWYNKVIQINIANLAGIPSIVYGMLGLGLFVQYFGLGRSLLSGSLTLALLILPVIIVSTQEALRSVPKELRQGSLAHGASKWQTTIRVAVPSALPGILTGSILALSRAIGEAAPLIMVGAAGFVAFLPKSLMDSFTVLPIQIYNWTSRPQAEFHQLAASGIIVLMSIMLFFNAIAIVLRNKYQQKYD